MRRMTVTAPVAGSDCRQRPHLPARRANTTWRRHEFFDRMHGFAPIAHGIGVVGGAHVGAIMQAIVALDRANEADIRVQGRSASTFSWSLVCGSSGAYGLILCCRVVRSTPPGVGTGLPTLQQNSRKRAPGRMPVS